MNKNRKIRYVTRYPHPFCVYAKTREIAEERLKIGLEEKGYAICSKITPIMVTDRLCWSASCWAVYVGKRRAKTIKIEMLEDYWNRVSRKGFKIKFKK